MPSYEGLRLRLRSMYRELTARARKKKIQLDEFTIISNNCWGGMVYESYGMEKQSPTVGLFIMAEDYIRFLSRLKEYIHSELRFIDPMASRWAAHLGENPGYGSYPVGVLGGGEGENVLPEIEIFFLHYHSEQEAREKWTRRCARIDWEHLLVKFNDQNLCTAEEMRRFESLPFEHKICFAVKDYPSCPSVIRIPAPKSHGYIRASYEPFGKSPYVDINQRVNELV